MTRLRHGSRRTRRRGLAVVLRVLWAGLLVFVAVGCRGRVEQEQAPAPVVNLQPAAVQESPSRECAARIQQAEREPELAGATAFESKRPQILARAKAEPILFWRAPKISDGVSPEVATLRKRIELGPNQGFALHSLYRVVKTRPEIAQALLLREGYFYAEDPDLAVAMVNVVELHHLFKSPELFIQRGSEVIHVVKAKRGFWYEYADGAEKGKRARLFLLDRVVETKAELQKPLHVDVRDLAYQLGFEQLKVRHISEESMVADLRYGEHWVPSLLSREGSKLKLECEQVEKQVEPALARTQQVLKRRTALVQVQQRAIAQMVEESLPFDEPRTEEGQQDGNLRPAWIWAYNHGWDSYTFNDDGYSVFDNAGRPLVPQVCIDFITDTFERASGTWWTARQHDRQRVEGLLDFNQLNVTNRRSVEVIVKFAWEHPEMFDVYDLEAEERVPFIWRERFFDHLYQNRDRYRPGDVVAIHGLRSDGEMHYHSFFVYEADPVSGMPILLAGNAGKPRIRTWENVMRSAPRRSIKHRLRPRLEWLESFITPDPSLAGRAPTLSSSPT
ncbi:MAG: hypothetical protein H6718_13380 [Polyangiaceae bacterium]|nr:hypothetical protein [Myxococcales bacterium]MCB9586389.1 hypothetical protein [Polyangiaceae bacterium]MCB9607063.1 hypothetical protein [Polyangiaceae bacterium]